MYTINKDVNLTKHKSQRRKKQKIKSQISIGSPVTEILFRYRASKTQENK